MTRPRTIPRAFLWGFLAALPWFLIALLLMPVK